MAVKVGINGFGRIGRNVFRTALGNPDIEFVAVNDLTTPATLAHLLKYDSILGNLKQEITHGEDFIAVDGKKVKVFAQRDPALLDWASVGALLIGISTLLFVVNVIVAYRRPIIAGDNPWDASSLEWFTSSPPPHHNFVALPPIRSERPVWDYNHPDKPALGHGHGDHAGTHPPSTEATPAEVSSS